MVLILNGICQTTQNYMPIFGTFTERDWRENIPKHGMQRFALDFPGNTLGDGPSFWIFGSHVQGLTRCGYRNLKSFLQLHI